MDRAIIKEINSETNCVIKVINCGLVGIFKENKELAENIRRLMKMKSRKNKFSIDGTKSILKQVFLKGLV
ncbi:hypothetical protein [Eubacterium maltosivorans]|uniref:hypothetical protein n=1 Tax=Eubacterium maltosivorans TaxID=2041044 RepID=UPI000944A6EF|nr:hypothetical protein [Eubacterium maltosivorans]